MKKIILLSAVAFGLAQTPAMADSLGTVSPKLSTLGVGVEYKYPVTDEIAVSAGLYGLNVNRTKNSNDMKLDAKLKLRHFSVLGNYYPWDNGFHVAGGLVLNKSKVTAHAVPKEGQKYEFNGRTYETNDVGSADVKIDFRKAAPYLGIGWDNGNKSGAGFSVAASLGVMFTGSPKVDFSYTEGAGMTALKDGNALEQDAYQRLKTRLDHDIAKEEKDLKDDVNGFKAYPVVSIGFSYNF